MDGPRARARKTLRVGEIGFAAAELILRLLALFDISQQSKPPNNAALRVALRQSAPMEPAVSPIRLAHAVFQGLLLTGLKRQLPCREQVSNIVGMNKFANKVARRPTCQFLSSLARVFEKPLVNEFQLVICGPNHNKSWNAVDDEPKLYFA